MNDIENLIFEIAKLEKQLTHDRDYELDDPDGPLARQNDKKELKLLDLKNRLLTLKIEELEKKKKKYRIWESHCGDPSIIHDIFEADNDEEAKRELERVRALPSSGYSIFWMQRIDQEEKVTGIS